MADYEIPEGLLFSREDEWVRIDGDRALVGITDYAQQQLGDVVFVELPARRATVEKGEPFGVIESVKAVSDLYAPVTGEVVDVNVDLADHPEIVNEDCYGDAWMISIEIENPSELEELLDAAGYTAYVSERKD